MRKNRFSGEQIIHALKEHEAGTKAADLSRRLGISDQTFYRWMAKYGGMRVVRVLGDLNRRRWMPEVVVSDNGR